MVATALFSIGFFVGVLNAYYYHWVNDLVPFILTVVISLSVEIISEFIRQRSYNEKEGGIF